MFCIRGHVRLHLPLLTLSRRCCVPECPVDPSTLKPDQWFPPFSSTRPSLLWGDPLTPYGFMVLKLNSTKLLPYFHGILVLETQDEVLHDLLYRTPRTRWFYPHPYPPEQFNVKWIRTRKWSYYTGLAAAQNSLQSDQQGIVSRGLSEHLEWFFWNRTSLCYGILPECTFEDSNLERTDLTLKKKNLKYKPPKAKS